MMEDTARRSWICPQGCSRTLLLCWVLLLGLDVTKHIAVLGADPPPPQLDAYDYWQLGGQMADGDWLLVEERGAFRTPGLPLFVAGFRALCGLLALQMVLCAQHLIVMATSWLSAAICGRITGSGWYAWLGYALSASSLARSWHANLVLSETLFTFFLVSAVALFIRYLEQPAATTAMWTGVLIGLATLVRPVSTYLWIPYSAVIVVSALLRKRGTVPLWRVALHVALLALATYGTLAPWLARNQMLFGSPFMTQFLGRNLWVVTFEEQSGSGLALGNGPRAQELRDRLAEAIDGVTLHDTWSVSDALTTTGMPDDAIDLLMLQVCQEEIAKARGKVAYRTFRRVVNFWRAVSNPYPFYNWRPDQATFDGQKVWSSSELTDAYRHANRFAASRSLRMNEFFIVCVGLGLLSLLLRAETRMLALGLGLTLLYFNVVTATLEIESYRYRMILEPIMVVCAVAGLGRLLPGKTTGGGSRQRLETVDVR